MPKKDFEKVRSHRKGLFAYRLLKVYMEANGFVEKSINGSHHIWQTPDGMIFSVPVHSGEVKACYVKSIRNWIEKNLET